MSENVYILDEIGSTTDPNDLVKRYYYRANEEGTRCGAVTFTLSTIHNLRSAKSDIDEMFAAGQIDVGLYIVIDIVGDSEHRLHWTPEKPGGVTVQRFFVI